MGTDSDVTENREQDKNILLPVLSTFKLYSAIQSVHRPLPKNRIRAHNEKADGLVGFQARPFLPRGRRSEAVNVMKCTVECSW